MRILREWLHRLVATIRPKRSDEDLAEELRAHAGLAADGGRRAGGASQAMDALRDQRGLSWLDAMASDVVFGWRHLRANRAASGAAILSLGLAIGATMAAFRLVDAVLLRPLPVAEPDRLFVVSRTTRDPANRVEVRDDFDYPTYRAYTRAVGARAELMVIGLAARQPMLIGSSAEPEAVVRQYVSGNAFGTLGLQPAIGRALNPLDDAPGAPAVAVISHDFWTRRFAQDPSAIGGTFRSGSGQVEIVGVAPQGFTGTEPGRLTDVFMPASMNTQALDSPGWSWFRIWVRPVTGVSAGQVRQVLDGHNRSKESRGIRPEPGEVDLRPAGAGVSGLQKTFARPLLILMTLAALVLLIACANVANLMAAQTLSRERELALRVSIGAGRWRVVQLVLVESALVAIFAAVLGMAVAWWSPPIVVSMLAPVEEPVTLVLTPDWRTVGVGGALALVVMLLFGLGPALRASRTKPVGVLASRGEARPHRRVTNALIGLQMAFCGLLLFVAGLFVMTFDRLVTHPLGFSDRQVVLLQAESRQEHPPERWAELVAGLRGAPGVQSVAVAGWPPLSGNRWRTSVAVSGRHLEAGSPYCVDVSPGYFAAMRIELIDGREFRTGDVQPTLDHQRRPVPGAAIVNEAFTRVYFEGQSPVGRTVTLGQDQPIPAEIVGLVRDAVYDTLREPMTPTIYVPIAARDSGTLIVRVDGDALSAATGLRREVSRLAPDIRVRGVARLSSYVTQQLIRERLLAAVSTFFAIVALLLSAIGLYGMLSHAVLRRRREIGIRMALGASAARVAIRLTTGIVSLVGAGAAIGIGAGLVFAGVMQTLLFGVTPTDATALLIPLAALACATVAAALPPVLRAVRIDPAETLRSE